MLWFTISTLLIAAPFQNDLVGTNQYSVHEREVNAWTQPSPYQAGQWFEYWTNNSGAPGGYLLYKITPDTNATWWSVEVWNETENTLNQTAHIKRISDENGHRHVYGVSDYSVYSIFSTSHPTQWDRWFNLTGVTIGSTIGPIESEEGDNITLTVNTTETITTPAGTFECWVANQTTSFLGTEFRINYWIDKESNITVRASTEIPAWNTIMIDKLTAASWLTPPNITGVNADPLRFSATITWDTDEPADSIVKYGMSTANINETATDVTLVTVHSITLTSLQPLTTYYFEVLSSDDWGNQARDNNSNQFYTFTTLSANAPEISTILATALGNTSVSVTFDTNKETNATVRYSQTRTFNQSSSDPGFKTHHEIVVTGLKENTEYFYYIEVSDSIGNRANSTIRSFVTLDETAPHITLVNHTTSKDELVVQVDADEPFRGELYAGTMANAMILVDNETSYLTMHQFHATALPSYTIVYFQLRAVDPSGNVRIIMNGSAPFTTLIPDYLRPEVNHPDDIFLTEGETLPNITWIISDQTPSLYVVRVDGQTHEAQKWSADQTTVTVLLNQLGLNAGTHTVEIILRDKYGNTASDIVVVTISPAENQPAEVMLTNNLLYGAPIVLIALAVMRGLLKRRGRGN